MSAARMTFNVLIKKENGGWTAHCLELDIVAQGESFEKAKDEIQSLITIQLDYALANDNMKYFFKPAPDAVWAEFFACRNIEMHRRRFYGKFTTGKPTPSHIVTNTTSAELVCHA